jgi:hypothetical protein
MSKVTAAKAKYFENNKSANSLWFISNGLPFKTQNDAQNQARELEKKGKSGEVVEITRAEVEAWKAAEAGGNAPASDENKEAGAPAGGEENEPADQTTRPGAPELRPELEAVLMKAAKNTVAGAAKKENKKPAAKAGGNAPAGDENKTPGTEAGGNAGAGDENKETGAGGDENKTPGAPADKEKALAEALAKLEEAKGAQALLAANAAKAKKSAAQAAVDAAEALVAELSK